jgi:hypothetical protein
MCEAHLCLIALPRDVDADFGARPLSLVSREVEMVVQHPPDVPFSWDELGDLDCGTVEVPVPIGELRAEFVGRASRFSDHQP